MWPSRIARAARPARPFDLFGVNRVEVAHEPLPVLHPLRRRAGAARVEQAFLVVRFDLFDVRQLRAFALGQRVGVAHTPRERIFAAFVDVDQAAEAAYAVVDAHAGAMSRWSRARLSLRSARSATGCVRN